MPGIDERLDELEAALWLHDFVKMLEWKEIAKKRKTLDVMLTLAKSERMMVASWLEANIIAPPPRLDLVEKRLDRMVAAAERLQDPLLARLVRW